MADTGWKAYDDTIDVPKASANGWTSYDEDIAKMQAGGDTRDTKKGRYPIVINDTTGAKHEIHFGQLATPEMPLPQQKPQYQGGFNPQTLAQSPDYQASPPQVQQQMMNNLLQSQAGMLSQKGRMFGTGTKRDVMGIGGSGQQRQAQSAKPQEYLAGEMPHWTVSGALTDPEEAKTALKSIPRSAVRGAAKAVELVPFFAAGGLAAPAYAAKAGIGAMGLYGAAQAGSATLDAKEGERTRAFTENLGEQASGLGRMLTDPFNIAERKDTTKPWSPGNTRASYSWDSPGEAAIDAVFGYEAGKGLAKSGKWVWDEKIKTKPNQEQFMRTAADNVSKMASGSTKGKMTPAQRKGYDRKAGEAFEFILQNKDLFNVLDNEGQRIELPRNRVELAEFIDQGKNIAFKEYDYLRQQTEGLGTGIKLDPVITELERIIADPNNRTVEAKPIVEAARKKLAEYGQQMAETEGQYSLSQAQNAITIANQKLKTMYGKGASYADTVEAVIDKGIADVLRKEMDKIIDSAEGPSYQDWKNKYAALKAIEEDVNRAANRQRNAPEMSVDFSDVYSMSKLALSLAKADPAIGGAAAAGWLTKKTINRYKPDPTIERTFKKLNKLVEPPKDNSLVGPEYFGLKSTPREQFIPTQDRPPQSPLNRPGDIDPSLRDLPQTLPIERGERISPTEIQDPSLRNIAPTEEFSPRDTALENKFDLSHQIPKTGNEPSPVTLQRPPAGEQAASRSAVNGPTSTPQDVSPVDISYTRQKLTDLGFTTDQVNSMLDAVKKGVLPVVAITAYMAMDDDQKKASMPLLLGMVGGKPFYSELRKAVESPKFPESIKGQSLPNAIGKLGNVTKAEMDAVGIFDLARKDRVTRAEILDAIEKKGIKLGKDVYGGVSQLDPLTKREMAANQIREDLGRRGELTSDVEDAFDAWVESGSSRDAYALEKLIKMDPTEWDIQAADTQGKQPQFSGYQAIKSQEGVVPGSYTEEFVTVEEGKSMSPLALEIKHVTTFDGRKLYAAEHPSSHTRYGLAETPEEAMRIAKEYIENNELVEESYRWKDEHAAYSDTKNPLVRIRYDVKELPDGRKVMRLQELQDPKEVRRGRTGEGSVPQALSERAMDIGIKKAIATAKEQGLDGIEWSTGEQQRDLYNSALRGVADEARWNPETLELTVYKNGSLTQTVPNVAKDALEDYIGKSGATRLLESEIRTPSNKWKRISGMEPETHSLQGTRLETFLDPETNKWEIYDGEEYIGNRNSLSDAMLRAQQLNKGGALPKEHIATDLSIDAKWPGKLYGDFVTNPSRYEMKEIDHGHRKTWEVIEVSPDGKSTVVEEFMGTRGRDKAIKSMQDYNNNSRNGVTPDFDYKATVPSLLKKYGKGEFGVSAPINPTWEPKKLFQVRNAEGEGLASDTNFLTRDAAQSFIDARPNRDYFISEVNETTVPHLGKKPAPEQNQPVMWFTDKTPSSFAMYMHPATIVAATGLSLALVKQFLSLDDKEKKKMAEKYVKLKAYL